MSKFPELTSGSRPIAVVSFAQAKAVRADIAHNEVEMLLPVFGELFAKAGITKDDLNFICSGSTDYLIGGPFSFVMALDAIGVWPPKAESHVEMDAAWALYEAWVTMQEPGKDVSLVYGFGKSSLANDLGKVLALQMDPYTMAPLWPDPTSVAALQARAMLDAGLATEEDFAEVASRNRRNALKNPYAQVARDDDLATLMAEAYVASPLRRHCLPPITDGCSALILVAGERAYDFSDNPAWITGIDHRMETHALGARDLTRSPSTERAALEAGVAKGGLDLAEIYAPYAHQELILAKALGLGADTQINPSGGALAANAIMSAGLTRIGEAATRIMSGEAKRAVAHASAGPVLQQNLVAVLEGAR